MHIYRIFRHLENGVIFRLVGEGVGATAPVGGKFRRTAPADQHTIVHHAVDGRVLAEGEEERADPFQAFRQDGSFDAATEEGAAGEFFQPFGQFQRFRIGGLAVVGGEGSGSDRAQPAAELQRKISFGQAERILADRPQRIGEYDVRREDRRGRVGAYDLFDALFKDERVRVQIGH